ncbi:MAG: discoidin domain-containing protein [Opitutaceae bacterium]|nr:discoidin domain-containing protein [Opitutaceae bacterium]
MKSPGLLFATLGLIAFVSHPIQAADVDKASIKVTASGWEAKAHGGVGDFPPANTLDGRVTPDSSWRAEGPGTWIQWDLGTPRKLRKIGLAFLFGDKRYYTFDLLVTNDPTASRDWRPVRLKAKSTGNSLGFEMINLDAAAVRHVRLVGYGNSSAQFPKWTNLTEVAFEE